MKASFSVINKAPWSLRREAVLMITSLVPPGRVTTYGSIARLLGISPREVATALKWNPNPIIVPCHRVIMSDCTLGGYGRGGPRVKERLLRLEGVEFIGERVKQEYCVEAEELLNVENDVGRR